MCVNGLGCLLVVASALLLELPRETETESDRRSKNKKKMLIFFSAGNKEKDRELRN